MFIYACLKYALFLIYLLFIYICVVIRYTFNWKQVKSLSLFRILKLFKLERVTKLWLSIFMQKYVNSCSMYILLNNSNDPTSNSLLSTTWSAISCSRPDHPDFDAIYPAICIQKQHPYRLFVLCGPYFTLLKHLTSFSKPKNADRVGR